MRQFSHICRYDHRWTGLAFVALWLFVMLLASLSCYADGVLMPDTTTRHVIRHRYAPFAGIGFAVLALIPLIYNIRGIINWEPGMPRKDRFIPGIILVGIVTAVLAFLALRCMYGLLMNGLEGYTRLDLSLITAFFFLALFVLNITVDHSSWNKDKPE